LNALSEDRGPDIFSIQNTWLRKYENKIAVLPKTTTLPYEFIQGTLKKEKVTELRTTPTISLRELKTNFVDAVPYDVVIGEDIYGLPLSLDTMVMFYNKELLNNAGIAEAARNWTEFQEQVKRITKQDKKGNILQSGAAIGTSTNIERSSDLLSLLMMQNGTVMADDNGYPKFSQTPATQQDQSFAPGEEALNFYTRFSNPAKEIYTWNDRMPGSLEAFISGQTAFFFGYAYHIPIIKAQAPKLDWAIAKMPQIENAVREINFANYWVETVSKKTKYTDAAWDFVQFAAKAENDIKYLEKTKKPTALRALIARQLDDLELGPFAAEVLTARSWYRGQDALAVESIFREMIDNVVQGKTLSNEAIRIASSKVDQTINKQ
jgi:multiple sugar transport system substrate-binding protein